MYRSWYGEAKSIAHRRGLTLIEFLVVIAVIAILAALVLYAANGARESAREVQCKSNIYQLMIAAEQFTNTNKRFPGEQDSWTIDLLPYMGDAVLQRKFKTRAANPETVDLFRESPHYLRCPTRTGIDGGIKKTTWPNHYVFIRDPNRDRDNFSIGDAPLGLHSVWSACGYTNRQQLVNVKGPHSEGYFIQSRLSQGVHFHKPEDPSRQ
jgi:prepilin-type N-terminal cleavage/methylation domain-containing protein